MISDMSHYSTPTLVKMFSRKGNSVLIIADESGYCPYCSFEVFVNGIRTDICAERSLKSPDWGCSFTGKIYFPDEYQYLRDFLEDFLKKKIFERPISAREIGVENAYNLLTGKGISQKQIECFLCR
jgi:hypothetical protein